MENGGQRAFYAVLPEFAGCGGLRGCNPRHMPLFLPRPLGEGWGEGSPQGAQSAKQAKSAEKKPFVYIKLVSIALATGVSSYEFHSYQY